MDRGTDKVILIQSVILLAFWYSDPQDHTGAWYWIGVAISLALGAGLHRQPGRIQSPASPHLTRRIWWTLLVRDRWVALAKGRPVRIHSESYDVPLPGVDDVMVELEGVAGSARRFIPAEARELTGMWLQLVQVSDILGDVLRIHYRAKGPEPQITEIYELAQRLHSLTGTNVNIGSDFLRIHAHQTELFHRYVPTMLLPVT